MKRNKYNNPKTLFKKVKLLVLDVDGVLTKGEIIYDDQGRELKSFNVKDGLGVSILGRLGIHTIFLSANNSPVLHRRAKDMGVEEIIGGFLPKEKALDQIKSRYRVTAENICFIGDDLLDLGLMKIVGAGVAVGDASLDVKKVSCYITRKNGGEGAVREVVDLIIKAQGLENKVIAILENIKR